MTELNQLYNVLKRFGKSAPHSALNRSLVPRRNHAAQVDVRHERGWDNFPRHGRCVVPAKPVAMSNRSIDQALHRPSLLHLAVVFYV